MGGMDSKCIVMTSTDKSKANKTLELDLSMSSVVSCVNDLNE